MPPKLKRPEQANIPYEASQLTAKRLIEESCQLHYAHFRGRWTLYGMEASSHPSRNHVSDQAQSVLKKLAPNWTLTSEGFSYRLTQPDVPAIAQIINGHKEELGIFQCIRIKKDYVLQVSF